jgi:acetolactate synthase I/II/III large subunit
MPTLAELVVDEAKARGNRYIFGIPGGGSGLSLVAAAQKAGVEFVLVNNEATAAMAAGAYGQFIGGPGLCFSIQATGGANMIGGIASCYLDRRPVVAITDRYPDAAIGHISLQDAHLSQVFAPLVKRSAVLRPQGARRDLHGAFDLAWQIRQGAVHLDIPTDVADASVTDGPASPETATVAPTAGDMAAAVNALQRASRIVVFVGSDAARSGAGPEMRRLVENCRAAAIVNMQARGLLPDDHPRYGAVAYGMYAPNTSEMDFLSQADLVVLAGVDPVELHQPWPASIPSLQVQLSPEMEQPAPAAGIKLFGPLRDLLGRLADSVIKTSGGFSENEIHQIKQNDYARYAARAGDPLPAQGIFEVARRLLPRNTIVVQETGVHNVLNDHIFPVYMPDTMVNIGGSRTMGSSIPWAIGAALARPQQTVLACCGDGSFLMRVQELEVIARLGLRMIILIFNDHQLGTIRARERARGLHVTGLTFPDIDFSAIGRGFGLSVALVEDLGSLESALQAALSSERSTVIDARLDPEAYVGTFGPMLGWPAAKK